MFQEESDVKIRQVIEQATQETNSVLWEEKKMKQEIEKIKYISEQTKLEMIFNNDLAYQYEFNTQSRSCNRDQNKEVLTNQKNVVVDLMHRIRSDYEDEKFDSQAFEVAKTVRLMLREITNPYCSQLLSTVFIWMVKWMDCVYRNNQSKIERIEEKQTQKTLEVKMALEKRWLVLEEGVKNQIEIREQKIKELQQSLNRLIEDKRHIEDTLRNREEEIQLLIRNTDYSHINVLLRELKESLDMVEESNLERDPYIQKLKDVVHMLKQGEKDKLLQKQQELEDSKKKIKITKIKIRKSNVETSDTGDNLGNHIIMKGKDKRMSTRRTERAWPEPGSETKSHHPIDGGVQSTRDGTVKCPQCFHSFQVHNHHNQEKEPTNEANTQIKHTDFSDYRKEVQCQTQLCLIKEPYASLVNQLYELSKCRATIINNRKVLVLPKERTEISDLNFKSAKDATLSQSYGVKQSDATVLKVVEVAMEEMVMFEIQDKSSLSKMYDFREYLFEHLLNQYGLRNIAQKNYEQVIQRLQEQAGDTFNRYSILLLNILGQFVEDEQEVFSVNKQHVLIFARIVFADAQGQGKGGQGRGDQSPTRKKIIDNNVSIASLFQHGGEVSVFDLCEVMSKYMQNTQLDMRLLLNIQPTKSELNELDDSQYSQRTIEIDHLDFAKMKVTSKIAKFGFDHKYFVETLDVQGTGKISLLDLIDGLQSRFQIFLTQPERDSLVRLFPKQNTSARGPIINLYPPEPQRPLSQITYTQQEYVARLKNYMITKTDFMQYVLKQWEDNMHDLGEEIAQAHKRYDTLFNRGGLNLSQFQNLIKNEKVINQNMRDGENLDKAFVDALQFLEENDDLRKQGLLGTAALKEILLERNIESLPFYSYVKYKYGGVGNQGGKKRAKEKGSPDEGSQRRSFMIKRI